MIFTDRTIIVQKGTGSINDTIILYRGDKGVEIRFTLNEGSPFKFGSGASPNIIEKTEAAYGQLIIKRPNDLPAIFSEISPTNEGKIVFTITGEMIDEITEVGYYTFQIRLFDENQQSRATIPEVINGIEIREPIAIEGMTNTNEVNVATVGYALTTAAANEDAFNSQGNYNKTNWQTGDRITAAKLNKIEAGIDGVNKKVASGGTGGEVDLSGYVTKGVGNASQIQFADGQTFQAKLDAGILKGEKGDKGDKGDTGAQGIQGLKGEKGDKGDPGSTEASDISIADTGNYFTSTNVEGALQEAGSQIKEIANQIESVGQPTQEQINIAIDQAITDGKVTSGGINSTAKTLLQTILQNAIYTTDQSANINALITALSTTTDPTVTNYTITNTLTNCTSSNVDTSVTGNTSYNTTITANEGYTLSNITVTMGGTDISSTAVSGNNITISSVTGDIVITASATEIITDDNLIDVSKAGIESGSGGKMPDNAQTTETFIVTPYIEVDNTKQYYTNLSSKVDTEGTIINWTQKIYFYDSSKTYIRCTVYQSGDLPSKKHAVSFPTGTAYVRVLFDTRYTTITPYFGLNSDDIIV